VGDIVFQESVATALNRRFIYLFLFNLFLFLVLGIPHPAVNTRDVALYQPFRNALRSHNQMVRLPTLTFHLMGRRCQEGQQNPVRFVYISTPVGTELIFESFDPVCANQLENARAAMDLYRSHAIEWETTIRDGQWPSALPPSNFSRCYL
jgi:RNA exonuclease 4